MKKYFTILGVFIISTLTYASCSNNTDTKQFIEFVFKGKTYIGEGLIPTEAYYDGSLTTVACQQAGYYVWFEIPGNSTGTFTKKNPNTAMTVEATEGNYDAYYDDGASSTNYKIVITRYDEYIEGTFTGRLIGGESGSVNENVIGKFYVKIANEE